ncbi:uncharacterized protein TM35_000841020 [Trypanosoma theileri]|uniref:Surface protein TolT n=1 Tax=Trypanosoma theileri TaxID=67003 RepID=A0A1X0NEY2_9TRYP|nr:uncharacterized protein TM35_000841020 [Trypanosoma theileri]ORC82785.1 hypothetical protein TM35_000841020 [Trypanosoma theileri]
MSMLSCRVLCLLAIVLCCVGVAHANASGQQTVVSRFVEQAKKLAGVTKELKEKCVSAGNAARQAAEEAHVFAVTTQKKLETIAANPEEVKKTKSKGDELIKNAMKAAAEAEKVREQTTDSADKTDEEVVVVELHAGSSDSLPQEIVEVSNVIKDARNAVFEAGDHVDAAKTYANDVKNVLQKLDAAVVAAAKEREKEKQVESQPQPQEQTNETSLPPTNATITNGTKRNDGSSSPALLRVPLLLLLLLSVLGCMAVC